MCVRFVRTFLPFAPTLFPSGYSGVTDMSRSADTCETILHTQKISSLSRYAFSVRLTSDKGVLPVDSWLNESPTSRGLNTQTRNPVDVANSTDVTTLPLLAWRPNDCTSRAIYRRYIFAPRRTPVSRERRRRRRRRRRQWRRTRTRKRSPRFLATFRLATRSGMLAAGAKAHASVLPMYGDCPSVRIRRR